MLYHALPLFGTDQILGPDCIKTPACMFAIAKNQVSFALSTIIMHHFPYIPLYMHHHTICLVMATRQLKPVTHDGQPLSRTEAVELEARITRLQQTYSDQVVQPR